NFERSLETLGKVGTIETIAISDLPYEAIARTILAAEGAAALDELIESGGIADMTAPEDRYTAYARDAILAKDYIRALRLRGLVARQIDGVLARLDALVAPSRGTIG